MALFSKWSARKVETEAATPASVAEPSIDATTSKVLPKFLSTLAQLEMPVLLDLGPVVGQNVAFFGERLSCRIHVEDLYAVLETYHRADNRTGVLDALVSRLQRVPGPVDGVLVWDFFDYLDRKIAPRVAAELVSLVKPGGVVYGFFGTRVAPMTQYTRYMVEAPNQFRQRAYPATQTLRTVFVTRDISKMFAGLNITETVLLKNSAQEVMLKRTR